MTDIRRGTPRWRLIAQELIAKIEADNLAPGARLPTEARLAAFFEVNRHTIRRAMETLVRQGLVRVEQGRGAFVADDVLEYGVLQRTRFSEWVRRQNKEPEGHILRVRELTSTQDVAAGLGIEPGAPVVLMERLGLADGRPVVLTDHHFPSERLPGIQAALRSAGSITKALAQAGVRDYVRRSTRVSARMPNSTEAELLQVTRARPLLVCENVNVDCAGTIIEFGVARYPSSRVQVMFEP